MKEVIEYGVTEAALAELKGKYAKVPDAGTKEGYALCKAGIAEIRPLRTSVEKRRKELKADALAYGRKVDDLAKTITNALVAIEQPMKDAKQVVDDEVKRIEEEKRQAEIKRIENIQSRIVEIKSFGDGLLNADSKLLQYSIDSLNSTVISDEHYGEFCDAASEAINATQERLTAALNERLELERQQEENERIRKEQEAESKRLAEEQAEIQRQQEVDAAKLKEEQEEFRKQQAEAQAKIDAEAAELKKKQDEMQSELKRQEDERLAEERAEAEKVKAEKEQLEREKHEVEEAEQMAKEVEAERQRVAAMKPDADKLKLFAGDLLIMDFPELEDEKCRKILASAVSSISAIHDDIMKKVAALNKSKAA